MADRPKIETFPLTDSLSPEQVPGAAARRNPKEVLVIGAYDDGDWFTVSSRGVTREKAVWYAELIRMNALGQ